MPEIVHNLIESEKPKAQSVGTCQMNGEVWILQELAWIELQKLNAIQKFILQIAAIFEEKYRQGLTYEQLKNEIVNSKYGNLEGLFPKENYCEGKFAWLK